MDVHVAVGVYQFVSAQLQYVQGKVNDRKLPQLKSRKKDAIETQEKWKDGKVFRPQQPGYEAVEVCDAARKVCHQLQRRASLVLWSKNCVVCCTMTWLG